MRQLRPHVYINKLLQGEDVYKQVPSACVIIYGTSTFTHLSKKHKLGAKHFFFLEISCFLDLDRLFYV